MPLSSRLRALTLIALTCIALAALVIACGRDGLIRSAADGPCIRDADCLDGLACIGGFCTTEGGNNDNNDPNNSPSCEDDATEAYCVDATRLRICEGDQPRTISCAPGYCDAGGCVDEQGCDEGARRCADNTPLVCRDGAWSEGDSCKAPFICSGGRCIDPEEDLPDLRADSATFFPLEIRRGEPFFVEYTISNIGAARVFNSRCTVFANVDGRRTDLISFETGRMDPGATLGSTIAAPSDVLRPGLWTIGLHCDPQDELAEQREDNNLLILSGQLRTTGDDSGIDLAVLNVTPFTDVISRGQPLEFQFGVYNNSESFIREYYCNFFVQSSFEPFDVYLGDWFDGELGPFEERYYEVAFEVPPDALDGPNRITAYCEAPEGERTYDNNYALSDFEVFIEGGGNDLPDIVAQFVDLSPQQAVSGEVIALQAEVCNYGPAPTGRFDVAFRLDSANGFEIGRTSIPRLSAFEDCRFIEIESQPLPCLDDGQRHTVFAIADVDRRVQEQDERNNTVSSRAGLTIRCDAMCEGDRYDFGDAESPPFIDTTEPELIICPGDIDLFAADMRPGVPTTVTISSTDPNQTLALRLYALRDPNGGELELLAESFGAFGPTTIFLDSLPDASFYLINVELFGDRPVPYDLFWSQDDQPGASDIVAARISPVGPFRPGDSAFAEYELRNDSMAAVSGSFRVGVYLVEGPRDVPNNRIFLGVFTEPFMQPGESRTTTVPLSIPPMLNGGAATLVLVADDGNAIAELNEGNNTTIAAVTIEGNNTCTPDALEPNDSIAQAAALSEGTTEGLTVCGANRDDDFFQFCVPAGGTATLTIAFSHAQGDIDASLLNQNGQPVDTSNGTSNTETLEAPLSMQDVCYYARVFLFGGDFNRSNTYSVTLDIEPPAGVCEDANEPNNTFSQAGLLDEASGTAQHLCPVGDVDLFRLPLMAGDSADLHVVAAADAPPGDLSVTVYGPTQSFITFRFARDVTIPIVAAESGDHYVRVVTSANSDAYTYTIFTQR